MCNATAMGAVEIVAGGVATVMSGGAATPLLMAGMAGMTSGVASIAQQQQANAAAKVINQQESEQQSQISAQANQSAGKLAMQNRQQRSAMIASASGQGINLGSNSFLASMQTNEVTQANNAGLIAENESNQRLSSQAQAQSELNSKASAPSALGALSEAALSAGSAWINGSNPHNSPMPGGGNTVAGSPPISLFNPMGSSPDVQNA